MLGNVIKLLIFKLMLVFVIYIIISEYLYVFEIIFKLLLE